MRIDLLVFMMEQKRLLYSRSIRAWNNPTSLEQAAVNHLYSFHVRRHFCRSIDTLLTAVSVAIPYFNEYYSAGTSRAGFKLIRRIFSISLARSLGELVSANRIFSAFIFLRRRCRLRISRIFCVPMKPP